jgi:ribosomal protein S21
MFKVKARAGESIDSLLRRFNKGFSETIKEVQKREFHLKKSVKAKEKSKLAKARLIQANKNRAKYGN